MLVTIMARVAERVMQYKFRTEPLTIPASPFSPWASPEFTDEEVEAMCD